MTLVTRSTDLEAIRRAQQATWASADFGRIGIRLQMVGESLCEAVNLRACDNVLDVAAGNGNASLAAARRFADVTSTDFVPELLEQGRVRAEAEGLLIIFRVANAEELPFRTGEFEVALSTFGVMFSLEPWRAASEMLRVVRPGGRIGLASWTPDGFVGELQRVLFQYVPSPPGVPSPLHWGTESRIVELFGRHASAIRTQRKCFAFRYLSAQHWLDEFRRHHGPIHRAFASLDANGQSALREELLSLLERSNRGGRETLIVPADYLEVVIRRA